MPGRTRWTQLVVLLGTQRSARCMRLSLDTQFSPSPIYHLYVLFLKISYQARFCLQISHPAILFIMLKGLLDCGSFIVHILLPGTRKAFTLSVFLLGVSVHVVHVQAPDETTNENTDFTTNYQDFLSRGSITDFLNFIHLCCDYEPGSSICGGCIPTDDNADLCGRGR